MTLEQCPQLKVDPIKLQNLITQGKQKYGEQADACLPLLQMLQEEYGYLPMEGLRLIAEQTQISGRQIYGVATFYAQFRLMPEGKNRIKVCHGTACHVRHATQISLALQKILNLPEGSNTTQDLQYTVEEVACLGCCSMAPVMSINDKVYGNLTPMALSKIITQDQNAATSDAAADERS
ncbi:MAG: NAD(P)H-dependent oxidoreductase subunit E [Bacteriovoracaceae bacterium]|nr:NAD(P)H-dependent oxidoreductase subunit E [Bacteriovoracaceae bacterium]